MKLINVNLSDEDLRLVRDTIVFIENKEFTEHICLIYLDSLNEKNRFLVRQTININQNSLIIILSSQVEIAKFAWEIGVFYFMDYPILKNQLDGLKLKLNQQYNVNENFLQKIIIPIKGGYDIINIKDICVIKGEGNYCKFYFHNNSPKTYTARLSDIMSRISSKSIIRVTKSLIINVDCLISIKNNEINFLGTPKVVIKLGLLTIRRVKKAILWLDN